VKTILETQLNLNCSDWVPNRGACIDACLDSDMTYSCRLHDKALRLICVPQSQLLKKHVEMLVKNYTSGGVEHINILICYVLEVILYLRITATSMPKYVSGWCWLRFESPFASLLLTGPEIDLSL